ncbi:TetR/AcrR family transcriptional regulator [Profundibacter amoris]|uniref:TetR/AcrR family transcriptional regulator n=1 Tax=Profundibacter amoris TaxID=2171755 RepID=A0A347UDZ9_9RHOB|nr:TetR/AcrR family transcriptional regulator [Profundibacter amoris]AXX97077.1 TetR/AcrR family transcriptional regulator [Profundibacter amoris]
MQEKSTRRSNKARSEEMRARLITVSRKLFAQKGFAETGTPEIVKAAQVTRGALYHHFADKTDLFRAVVLAEANDVANDIALHSNANSNAAEALREGAKSYFKSMQKPGRVRLLLLDGPAVLGQKEMVSIDATTGGNALKEGLSALLSDNAAPLAALAEIISAAFDRAALAIANGANETPYFDAISLVLEGLAVGQKRR